MRGNRDTYDKVETGVYRATFQRPACVQVRPAIDRPQLGLFAGFISPCFHSSLTAPAIFFRFSLSLEAHVRGSTCDLRLKGALPASMARAHLREWAYSQATPSVNCRLRYCQSKYEKNAYSDVRYATYLPPSARVRRSTDRLLEAHTGGQNPRDRPSSA